MFTFPPTNWEVYPLEEMEHRPPQFPETWKLGLETYLAVRPSDGFEGTFRLALGGCSLINVRFAATDVIPHTSMEAYTLTGQFAPENDLLQVNAMASDWADLQEEVEAGHLNVVGAEGEEARDAFLAAIKTGKLAKAPLAAAIRWMVVVAHGTHNLELQLQSLPCSKKAIKPLLMQDNVATVALARFPILTRAFDGRTCAGPVPVLFSENPDTLLDWLNNDVEHAHVICQSVAARYLCVENISVKEALTYLAIPRVGMGVNTMAREWGTEPATKRARQDGYFTEEYLATNAGSLPVH